MNSISANAVNAFTGVAYGFGAGVWDNATPMFVLIITGLMLMFASIGVYFILILREASIYIATAFIPLSLAFFIWPATSQFFRRLAEFLIAMILSKLVMVAAVALAVAAMTSSVTGQAGSPKVTIDGSDVEIVQTMASDAGGSQPYFQWLGEAMTTTIMFALVVFAPQALVKVFGSIGTSTAGRAIADNASQPGFSRTRGLCRSHGGYGGEYQARQRFETTIRDRKDWADNLSAGDFRLSQFGVNKGADDTYRISQEAIADGGATDATVKALIRVARNPKISTR